MLLKDFFGDNIPVLNSVSVFDLSVLVIRPRFSLLVTLQSFFFNNYC